MSTQSSRTCVQVGVGTRGDATGRNSHHNHSTHQTTYRHTTSQLGTHWTHVEPQNCDTKTLTNATIDDVTSLVRQEFRQVGTTKSTCSLRILFARTSRIRGILRVVPIQEE